MKLGARPSSVKPVESDCDESVITDVDGHGIRGGGT